MDEHLVFSKQCRVEGEGVRDMAYPGIQPLASAPVDHENIIVFESGA